MENVENKDEVRSMAFDMALNFKNNSLVSGVHTFDLYPKNRQISALCAAVPYVSYSNRKMLSLMIKFLEIREILKYYNRLDAAGYAENTSTNSVEALLSIFSQINANEKSQETNNIADTLKTAKQMQQVLQAASLANDLREMVEGGNDN